MYGYFLIRSKKRTHTIVQDLIDDMKRDKELIGLSGAAIVSHIRWNCCDGAIEALRKFLRAYRAYCGRNGYAYETEAFEEMRKWG